MQPGTPPLGTVGFISAVAATLVESDQVKQIDQVFCETGRGTAIFRKSLVAPVL